MRKHRKVKFKTSKDKLLVVDLEATCTETDEFTRREMEIIEIGAVLVDKSFNVLDKFQAFIKPVQNPKLTVFCKRLTKISQDDVDNASLFPEVMKALSNQIDLSEVVLATWGDWDEMKWKDDCRYHNVEYPFTEHINLKEVAKETLRLRRFQSIANTCYILDMDFIGQEHRAIVDAENIVRIFQNILGTLKEEQLTVH